MKRGVVKAYCAFIVLVCLTLMSVIVPLNAQQTILKPVTLHYATPEVEALIVKYAQGYGVPVELVRKLVKRESSGNPKARNGAYCGLLQIALPTARGMGYEGEGEGLLNPEENLRYAVKYLAGAYLVADGDHSQAIRLYQRGYYYDAKAKGLLEETGLKKGPKSPKTVY